MKNSILSTGKRETTKRENRLKILQSARTLFAKMGYDATSVRDIIHKSGLSTGTFYNYFNTKEEIFEELADAIIFEVRKRIKLSRHNFRFDLESISGALNNFFQIFTDDPELIRFMAKNQSILRDLRNKGKLDGILQDLETDIGKAVSKLSIKTIPAKLMSQFVFGTLFEVLADMVNNPEFHVKNTSGNLALIFQGGFLKLLSPDNKPDKM